MKLWHLKRIVTEMYDPYDVADEFVVRAETEDEARALIVKSKMFGDEGKAQWTNSNKSTCEELFVDGEPNVIIRDFKAG